MKPACNQFAFDNRGVTSCLVDRLDHGEGGAHRRSNKQDGLLRIKQGFGLVPLGLHAEVVRLTSVVVDRDVESKSRHHAVLGQASGSSSNSRRGVDFGHNGAYGTGTISTICMSIATQGMNSKTYLFNTRSHISAFVNVEETNDVAQIAFLRRSCRGKAKISDRALVSTLSISDTWARSKADTCMRPTHSPISHEEAPKEWAQLSTRHPSHVEASRCFVDTLHHWQS